MRRRTASAIASWLGAVALAVAPAAPAAAQAPFRGGPWMDAGIGYGRLRLTCDSCNITAAGGTEITVTVGGAPTRNVLLCVQGQIWFQSRGQRVHSVMAIVQWYPWVNAGFFARAGSGIVWGPVTPATSAQPAPARSTGIGMDFGVGYDLPVSRHYGFTVQAAWHVAALGDLTAGGQRANDVIAYVTRVGVALVFR